MLDNLEGDESLAQNLEEDQPKGDVLQKMNVPTAIRKGIEKKIVQKYPKWRQKEPEANLIQEGNEDNLALIVSLSVTHADKWILDYNSTYQMSFNSYWFYNF